MTSLPQGRLAVCSLDVLLGIGALLLGVCTLLRVEQAATDGGASP